MESRKTISPPFFSCLQFGKCHKNSTFMNETNSLRLISDRYYWLYLNKGPKSLVFRLLENNYIYWKTITFIVGVVIKMGFTHYRKCLGVDDENCTWSLCYVSCQVILLSVKTGLFTLNPCIDTRDRFTFLF